jgi:DNA topoisomerase-1
MSTIVDRAYVEQDKQRRFHPTNGGWVIASYLNKYFTDLVDVNFTAKTEDTLDDVSNGKQDKITALKNFWGPTDAMIDGARGIKTSEIIDEINEFMHHHLFGDTGDICPECGAKLGIKLSKFGPFIGCAKYPDCKYTKQLKGNEQSVNTPESAVQNVKNDAIELGDGIEFRVGKFGPYVTDGAKNVAAKQYTADTITLEIARDLLANANKKAEPIKIGENPETKKIIYYYPTGRYGAYISSNRVNVSVKEQPDLETAIKLINNKAKK